MIKSKSMDWEWLLPQLNCIYWKFPGQTRLVFKSYFKNAWFWILAFELYGATTYSLNNFKLYQIAKAMITIGKLLSANPVSSATDEEPAQETRMFKVSKFSYDACIISEILTEYS